MNDHKEGKHPEAHEEPIAWMVYTQIGDDECVTYGSTKDGVSIVARERYGRIKNAIFSNPIPLYSHPAKEEIQMKVSDEDYSVLASRILEEHRKYVDRLINWAEIAARKVVSDLRDMGYMNVAPKEKHVTPTDEELYAEAERNIPKDSIDRVEAGVKSADLIDMWNAIRKKSKPVLTDDEIERIAANLHVMPGFPPWSDEVREKQLLKRSYAAEAIRYVRDNYGFGSGLTVDKVMEVVEEFVKEEVEKGPDGALWNSGYSHEWIGLIVDLRTRIEKAAKQL